MNKFEVNEFVDMMIDETDIRYIWNSIIKFLEECIYCDVKDYLNNNPNEEKLKWLTREQCEFFMKRLCEYIFSEIEKEKTWFYLYHFPEYVSDLYHKFNLLWKQ